MLGLFVILCLIDADYRDAGKKSGLVMVTWQEKEVWKHSTLTDTVGDSLQSLELFAVVWTMLNLCGSLYVLSGLWYVVRVCERIEDCISGAGLSLYFHPYRYRVDSSTLDQAIDVTASWRTGTLTLVTSGTCPCT